MNTTKYTINELVAHNGVMYRVIDISIDGTAYDLHAESSDGELTNVPESEIYPASIEANSAADDIDMLVKVIFQLLDGEEDASAEIPDPTRHCKYWEQVSASDLCEMMEAKYKTRSRKPIPEEFLTSY